MSCMLSNRHTDKLLSFPFCFTYHWTGREERKVLCIFKIPCNISEGSILILAQYLPPIHHTLIFAVAEEMYVLIPSSILIIGLKKWQSNGFFGVRLKIKVLNNLKKVLKLKLSLVKLSYTFSVFIFFGMFCFCKNSHNTLLFVPFEIQCKCLKLSNVNV